MGIDKKYGRVTTEFGDIGEEEPVFLLRAQDKLAVAAIRAYMDLCSSSGAPARHVDLIRCEVLTAFQAWQEKNHTRLPNSDKYFARIESKEQRNGQNSQS